MNNEYVLHIESTETEEGQLLNVHADGVISGFGKVMVGIKALEALHIDDYMIPLLFKLYLNRDEMPQTVIDLSGLPNKED